MKIIQCFPCKICVDAARALYRAATKENPKFGMSLGAIAHTGNGFLQLRLTSAELVVPAWIFLFCP
ncbi:hypothetical protein CRM94_18435 [Burkholderia gladioli]|uniref:Uncharacterized protein n=1 Tax=Burkholderia gladioli TaxID=28095 RepID=A0A2A7RZF0_BURGA|nr:hypothetical protein CRM94_18435 [Burkholderia gladioli]